MAKSRTDVKIKSFDVPKTYERVAEVTTLRARNGEDCEIHIIMRIYRDEAHCRDESEPHLGEKKIIMRKRKEVTDGEEVIREAIEDISPALYAKLVDVHGELYIEGINIDPEYKDAEDVV